MGQNSRFWSLYSIRVLGSGLHTLTQFFWDVPNTEEMNIPNTNEEIFSYEFSNFVTMATYCVPDLPDILGFSGHLWSSILIFVNGASFA